MATGVPSMATASRQFADFRRLKVVRQAAQLRAPSPMMVRPWWLARHCFSAFAFGRAGSWWWASAMTVLTCRAGSAVLELRVTRASAGGGAASRGFGAACRTTVRIECLNVKKKTVVLFLDAHFSIHYMQTRGYSFCILCVLPTQAPG
jgi:hypothetical protein